MTVRVRQLTRTAGAIPPTPPIPPPVVTMTFVQQPGNTIEFELFDLPVSVQISDGANDVLRISSFDANCRIEPLTVTAVDGLALFTGLRAGDEGTGCRLQVENLSRPDEVEPIISQTFNTLESVPTGWTFLGAWSAGSSNGTNVTVNIDTTGADLVFATIVFFEEDDRAESLSDGFGQPFQPLTVFTSISPTIQSFYQSRPALRGPTSIQVTDPFASIIVFAFEGSRPLLRIEGPTFGNSTDGFPTIQSQAPAVINFPNALVFTGLGTFESTFNGPGTYTIRRVEFVSGLHFALGVAYKLLDGPASEQPTWNAIIGTTLVTNLIVFSTS